MAEGVVRVNTGLVVHDTLDGEVLAIRNDIGTYFSMVGAAADVWACILAGLGAEATATVLCGRYEVDHGTAVSAVSSFVDALLEQQLVLDGTGPSSTSPPAAVEPRLPWESPVFEAYTDMQDLLVFDPIHEVRPEGWPHVAEPGA